MKILDRYILQSFIQTFATVFIILFFIFILQGIWLFIAELAGKDLDIWLITKFLLFYSPKMIPLVLPLSILLASIMTFGSFAENYEFAAMKSSGISLSRAMRSLIVFIFGLSIVAFLFANNVIPKAEYKFLNLRKSILQRKPAMAIAEGQFNAIGTFNIKVDKKSGENGENLEGVTIHKRNPGAQNVTIIRSKTGLLSSSEKSNLLQLELFDGYYYEEVKSDPSQRERQPFAKSSFSKQIMNIDLSMLNNTDNEDDTKIVNTNTMLNVNELNYTIDSLQTHYVKDAKTIADNIAGRVNNVLTDPQVPKDAPVAERESVKFPKDVVSYFKTNDEKKRLFETASSNLSGADFSVETGKNELLSKIKNLNGHWLALYDKFVIAYACVLMFFIGAPLGAIIRKGGIGLPIVFAVIIFIVFHFINTFGRKAASENGIPPYLGAWMSSFVLSPLAVFLTYRATNDMNVTISFDWLVLPFKKLFGKRGIDAPEMVKMETVSVGQGEEWDEMMARDDSQLIDIVKNAKQFGYSRDYRNRALKVLELRGITQQILDEQDNLHNVGFLKMEQLANDHKYLSGGAFVTLIISVLFALTIAGTEKTNLWLAILGILTIVLFYLFLYKSLENLRSLGHILNRKIGFGIIPTLILGFPLYLILFFTYRAAVNKALPQYK